MPRAGIQTGSDKSLLGSKTKPAKPATSATSAKRRRPAQQKKATAHDDAFEADENNKHDQDDHASSDEVPLKKIKPKTQAKTKAKAQAKTFGDSSDSDSDSDSFTAKVASDLEDSGTRNASSASAASASRSHAAKRRRNPAASSASTSAHVSAVKKKKIQKKKRVERAKHAARGVLSSSSSDSLGIENKPSDSDSDDFVQAANNRPKGQASHNSNNSNNSNDSDNSNSNNSNNKHHEAEQDDSNAHSSFGVSEGDDFYEDDDLDDDLGEEVGDMEFCQKVMSSQTATINDVMFAVDELAAKWLRGMVSATISDFVSRVIHNFGLEYNAQTHRLKFVTHLAGSVQEKQYREERLKRYFSRLKKQRKLAQRRRSMKEGMDDDVVADDDDEDGEIEVLEGDGVTCVYDTDALRHAEDTEKSLIAHMQLVLCVPTFAQTTLVNVGNLKDRLTEVHDAICQGIKVLEHWFQLQRLARTHDYCMEHKSDTPGPQWDEFPRGTSGAQGRLLVKKSRMDTFGMAMAFLLEKCHFHKYRRSGDALFEEKIIPKYTLKTDENGECICETCRKPLSMHPMNIVSKRTDHAFKSMVEYNNVSKCNTYAWVRVEKYETIADFVRDMLSRKNSPHLWDSTLQIRQSLINELTKTFGEEALPVLEKSSEVANSFQNGVWFSERCLFLTYDQMNPADHTHLVTHYKDSWFDYPTYCQEFLGPLVTTQLVDHYGEDMMTWPVKWRYRNVVKNWLCRGCKSDCRYHSPSCEQIDKGLFCTACGLEDCECACEDAEGNKCGIFFKVDAEKGIPCVSTPCFDGIIQEQLGKYDDYDEVYLWLVAMLGRVLYPLNPIKYDRWEKMLCFFGHAGCGKSTIMNTIMSLILPEDVGILSMDAQDTFGLEGLLRGKDQLKCFIMEVTGDFKIPPQQFQSMMSGEPLSINRKGITSYQTRNWGEHVFMSGNAKPAWQDLAFAIVRRMFAVYMREEPKQKDLHIGKRIEAHEIGAILFKITHAYQHKLSLFRGNDPFGDNPYDRTKKCVPKTIIGFSEVIRRDMNPMFCLMHEGLSTCDRPMMLHKDFIMTLSDFSEQYLSYTHKRFPNCKALLTDDLMDPVFKVFKITKELGAKVDPSQPAKNRLLTTKWLIGIGLVEHYQEQIEAAEIAASQQDDLRQHQEHNRHDYDEDDDDDDDDEDDDEDKDNKNNKDNKKAAGFDTVSSDNSDGQWLACVIAQLSEVQTKVPNLTENRLMMLLRHFGDDLTWQVLESLAQRVDLPADHRRVGRLIETCLQRMENRSHGVDQSFSDDDQDIQQQHQQQQQQHGAEGDDSLKQAESQADISEDDDDDDDDDDDNDDPNAKLNPKAFLALKRQFGPKKN